MKKIFFISLDNKSPYGSSISFWSIVKHFKKNGYDISFLSFYPGYLFSLAKDSEIPFYSFTFNWWNASSRVIKTGLFIWQKLSCILYVTMLLFWSKSELLYINTAYHISPVIAAKILGKKSLIHVRESPDYFTPTSKYKKIRNYILKNWCDYFICVSEAVAANLRTHFPNAKVVVIHNGVDTSVFNDKTRDEIAIRSEYQIDKENFIVVSAGRMHPDKGPQVLVAALSNLVNKYPQIRGFLLGGPTNTDFFEQKIHSQVDQLKVRTLGYKKNSIDFFAIADVVIHPATYPEPLARTILEAMAMGKCVIATNVGGTSEIIQNGKNGILIPANDVDALSLAVERIVMNSSERERLGKNALQTIQSHFSEKKYVEKIKQFIQQEVYNKPSPI